MEQIPQPFNFPRFFGTFNCWDWYKDNNLWWWAPRDI